MVIEVAGDAIKGGLVIGGRDELMLVADLSESENEEGHGER